MTSPPNNENGRPGVEPEAAAGVQLEAGTPTTVQRSPFLDEVAPCGHSWSEAWPVLLLGFDGGFDRGFEAALLADVPPVIRTREQVEELNRRAGVTRADVVLYDVLLAVLEQLRAGRNHRRADEAFDLEDAYRMRVLKVALVEALDDGLIPNPRAFRTAAEAAEARRPRGLSHVGCFCPPAAHAREAS